MGKKQEDIATIHRYLDEAGDTTFFGKGKVDILGQNGVSKSFILGLVKLKEPLVGVRNTIIDITL